MEINYDKKVVAITGAGRGIGKKIAEVFAKCGATVAVIDINVESAIKVAKEIGGKAYICDVSNEDQVNDTFNKIVKNNGSLDVVINNAGILMRGFIEDFSSEDLHKVLNINLFGVYNCCRIAIKIMKRNKAGVIINATSVVNKHYAECMAGYCISKKAVEVLTKILASEAAKYGIRVNAYAPGTTETSMTAHLIKTNGRLKVKEIPMGRFGKPVDIAKGLIFLASDLAQHITGTVLEIDGGELVVHKPFLSQERLSKED